MHPKEHIERAGPSISLILLGRSYKAVLIVSHFWKVGINDMKKQVKLKEIEQVQKKGSICFPKRAPFLLEDCVQCRSPAPFSKRQLFLCCGHEWSNEFNGNYFGAYSGNKQKNKTYKTDHFSWWIHFGVGCKHPVEVCKLQWIRRQIVFMMN